MEYEDVNELIG